MRAGTRITASWPGTGLAVAISDIVRSSVIFHPWMTMLPSPSSSQTVGDPLLGESGSLPINRSDMIAFPESLARACSFKISLCTKSVKTLHAMRAPR